MRKLIIAFLMIGMWLNAIKTYSQCSSVPSVELVDNGDFEKGYLKSNGALYPDNSSRLFTTDLGYAFDFTGANCVNTMPDKFGIGKCESATTLSSSCAPPSGCNNPYAGYSYLATTPAATSFKDHTPGKSGNGFALVMDFSSCNSSSVSNPARTYSGGFPVAWSQKVNVVASQTYYFSAYFAQYTRNPGNSKLYFVVMPLNGAGVPQRASGTIVGTAVPANSTMNWQQFYGSWANTFGYTQVQISIEVDVTTTDCSTAGDFAFDDISFTNGCQNLTSVRKPTFTSSNVNLCSSSTGSLDLTAAFAGDPNLANNSISWYSGTTTQTLISGATSLTLPNISTANTYRICITDPDNSPNCPASATIVVDKAITVDFTTAVNLCSPAIVTLSPTITPSTGSKSYLWSVPAGATTPGTGSATATANVPGNYSLTVSNPSVAGCSGTDNINVTSSLPTAPTNLTYCTGGGTATNLVVGDGKKYTWYKDASKGALTGTVANNGTVTTTWTPVAGTTGDQTLYIQSNETVAAGTLQTKNLTDDAAVPELTITVNSTVLIKSFEAYVSTYGSSGTITATLSGAGTGTSTVNYTANNNTYYTFNVNWMLTPGTYKLNLTKTGGGSFKIVSTGTATSITEVSISGSGAWYGVRNMVVEKATSACDPVPVVVKAVACCTQPVPTLTPSPTTSICAGSNLTLTAGPNGSTGANYKWYKNGNYTTAVQNSTATTYTATTPANNDYFEVEISSSTSCAAASPSKAKVTVTVNAVPTVNATDASICSGTASNVALTSTPTGATFAWAAPTQTGVTGGAASSGSPTSIAQTLTGNGTAVYSVIGTLNGCPSTAKTVTITVKPIPTVNATDASICSGTASSVALTSTPTGATFAWAAPTQTGVTGGAASSGSPASIAQTLTGNGTAVYSVIGTLNGCPSTAKTVTITVKPIPTVNATDASICSGTASSVALTSTPTGATFAWAAPTQTGVTGGAASSGSPTSIAQTLTGNGTAVYSVIGTLNGCASTAKTVTITVKPIPTVNATDASICSGTASNVALTSTPTGATFAWAAPTLTGVTGGTASSGSPTSIAQTLTGNGTAVYSVIATLNGCASTAKTVTITVNSIPTVNATDASICSGTASSVALTSTPTGATFAWAAPTQSGVTGGAASSGSPTSIAQTLTGNGTAVYSVIGTLSGCASTAKTVTITVKPTPTVNATDASICSGTASSVALTSTPTGATFAWAAPTQSGVTGGAASSGSPTSIAQTLTGNGTAAYSVIGTLNGCASTAKVVTVTVKPNPTATITTSGAGLQYCAGGTGVVLTASPITGATYEWFLGASSQGAASGSNAHSSSLAGSWTVVVTLNGCSTTSAAVTVSTVAATTITTQPVNVGTCAGSNASFSVAATGTGLSYQWYRNPGAVLLTNNAKYSGVTTTSLSLTGVAAGDAGSYYAIISSTGPCAAVTSTAATLTITATETPTIAVTSNQTQICTGSSVTFTATGGGTGAGPVYVFYDATTNNPLTGGTQANPSATQSTYTTNLTATTGVYVKLTSNSTCLAGSAVATSSTVSVTVDQNPTASVAGTNTSICSSGTTLAGNNPTVGTGKWTQISPATPVVTFADATKYNTTVSGMTATGAYQLEWKISNGTCPSSASTVTITNVGSVTTPAAGTDAAICVNQTSYALAGNTPAGTETGTWTMKSSTPAGGVVTFGNANSPTSTASFSQAGVYTLTWTISNGVCTPSPSDDVQITVDALPTASVAGTNSSICSNGTTLAGNNPVIGTGKWTQISPATPVLTFADATKYNTTVSGLTSAGAYQLEWKISNGTCPTSQSTVTITNVGSVTTPAAGTDASICVTQTNYTLSGNTPAGTETGTWTMASSSTGGTVTFGNASSATSTASFSQAGVYKLTWTISNGVCTPSPSDEVQITVDEQPTTSVAGTPASICASSTTLAGNSPVVGTGKWTQVSPATPVVTFVDATKYNTTVSGLTAAGPYQLQWTISNGTCTASSTTVTITNVGNVTTPAAGTDATICETVTSFTLAANTPAGTETGTWTMTSSSTGGTVTFGNANSATSTASFSQAGDYILTWTISNGICTPSPSDDVKITVSEAVDLSTSVTGAASACEGSSINLTVSPSQKDIKYQAYIDGQTAGTQIVGIGGGINQVVPVDGTKLKPGIVLELKAEGCDVQFFPVAIDVLGKVAGLQISGASKVCDGQSAAVPYRITDVAGNTRDVPGTTTYTWTSTNSIGLPTGNTGNTVSANFDNLSGTSKITTTIIATPIIGTLTCGETLTKTVIWRPAYDGATIVGKESKICIGDEIELEMTNTNADGFNWSVDQSVSNSPTSLFSSTFKFNQAGTFTIDIQPSANPCTVVDSTVTVTVYPRPIANAGSDDYLESYATINLDGSGSSQPVADYTYAWASTNPNAGIANANVISTTATPKGLQTIYMLTVAYKAPELAHCTSVDDKEVIIDLKVETPNVFSPNGDGIHDTFLLPNIDLFPKAVLYIYNQWGELVFKSQPGYTNPWDGRRGHAACTVGTYYYLLELNAEGYKPIAGAVSIVR